MLIVAQRGARLHAPENSLIALLCAYTAGADALGFEVQVTRDGYLVVCHDPTTGRVANADVAIAESRLEELLRLDFSAKFKPPNSENFRYYHNRRHRLQLSTFQEALELLPPGIPKQIELIDGSTRENTRRSEVVSKMLETLENFDQIPNTVFYSKDEEALRLVQQKEPSLKVCPMGHGLTPERQLELVRELRADGLVVAPDAVIQDGRLTSFGQKLKEYYYSAEQRVGAVLIPSGEGGIEPSELQALSEEDFVWSYAPHSILDISPRLRGAWTFVDETFAGRRENSRLVSFGYAKANKYCHVFQDDGVHVKIESFDGYPATAPLNDIERRIQSLENDMDYAQKDWPFYSGGGFGLKHAIQGDFMSEVEYEVRSPMAQAVTLEMAAVNVDPGAHQRPWNSDGTPRLPRSFRNKDSFYDPHGAPPFVGVEHDEDDGYRINWNLGHEYDSNQYGRPVGDGQSPMKGRLRLERRGPYFSAYYRNEVDAQHWVCVGASRNDSLNQRVFLRCAAKRWRQERSGMVSEFMPIKANEFIFRNLRIRRFH